MKWLLSFISALLLSLMLTSGSSAREEIRSYIADITAVSYTHLTLPTICSV